MRKLGKGLYCRILLSIDLIGCYIGVEVYSTGYWWRE
jgi:hypothetical protein